ncbi:cupin domain-containing protein [Shewanella sp. KT0246]|uniref:cupin domain-containing protein n=1 Tax=Shewanella sp. KT0246 TaxID=2815912 RepID=UPI001BC5DF1D|nr:cupin domain-containing protein [Shewanella sp. KT0246]GIU54191.1 hypothetical protein TUM4249_38320 [Shewanella sp. KT0246]
MKLFTTYIGWLFTFFLMLSMSVNAIEPTKDIEVTKLLKATHSWDGKKLPEYPTGQPEITILKISIAAGSKLPLHQHPVINAGILTKGQLKVTTEYGEELMLTAGSAIAETVDKWHFGENIGEETAEIIVFYAGIEGASLTIKH